MLKQIVAACAALVALLAAGPGAGAQPVLVDTLDPGLGTLVAIGLDPVTGHLFIHPDFDANIHEFTPDGDEILPRIPRPGTSSNDIDFDFAGGAVDIGGTVVPAGTLLVFNGEDSPPTLRGVDKDTGAVLATVVLPNVVQHDVVGGVYHPGRGTVFVVDWPDDVIREIDPSTGVQVAVFPVAPAGSPAFDVFFGDVDLSHGSGTLFVVSDSQPRIRELTITGQFVRDIDVSALGVRGMSGIALDQLSGEAWIASTGGRVYRLGGLGIPGRLAHFLCHKARTRPGTPALAPGEVMLDDGRGGGPVRAVVQRTASLCNPATADGQVAGDAKTHLKNYKLQVAASPVTGLEVRNGLGTLRMDTIEPERLLVPAAHGLAGPVAPPDPGGHAVDHFQCHKIRVTRGAAGFPRRQSAQIADAYADGTFSIRKPSRLCVPVDRDGQGIADAAAHLACYKVKRTAGSYEAPPAGAVTADAFGDETLGVVKEEELCVPSRVIRVE